jgi:hypothetical protein
MATAAKFVLLIPMFCFSLAYSTRCGWTNFATVAMETKKGGFKLFLDSFHQTS